MALKMDDVLISWNESFPNHPLTAEDFQKPRPIVVMEAIVELLDSFGIDIDGIIRLQPDIITENSEAFAELIPVMLLTEAVNFMLLLIARDWVPITLYDLLSPSPSTTQSLFRVLLNYKQFIEERRMDIMEKEKELEDYAHQIDLLAIEKEDLMNKKYTLVAAEADRDFRMNKYTEKIGALTNEQMEYKTDVKELQTRLDLIHQELDDELKIVASEQTKHVNLHDEINKLRSMVVSETEQDDTQKALELAEEQDKEMAKAIEEAHKTLWVKESTVKTLQTNTLYLSDCQNTLSDLQKLCDKISAIESTNNPGSEERQELQALRTNTLELVERNNEIKAADQKWVAEIAKTEGELRHEYEILQSDEKKAEWESEEAIKESHQNKELEKQYQTNILNYDKKRQHFLDLYTMGIPKQYDEQIKYYVDKLRQLLTNTYGGKIMKKE